MDRLCAGLALLLCLQASAAEPRRPLVGASVYAAMESFKDPAAAVERLKSEGFGMVSLVPTYPYIDYNRIDYAGGPSWESLENAVTLFLSSGLAVVLKPHLDPPSYIWGYKPPDSVTHSWRMDCPWRGYFDVDPMSPDYREGLVKRSLETLAKALARATSKPVPFVRLELGSELMNSVVAYPERWERLLAYAKTERVRLGLVGKVALSHNFEHHFEMTGDEIVRMTPEGRKALARYIKGLDALALSQYMDLTAAMPAAERGARLPTVDEVAEALALHEKNFRQEVLQGGLGLKPSEIRPIHIGEFGIGRGGLAHPNVWSGDTTPEQEKSLAQEIALGHAGLMRYLETHPRGDSASLWTVGKHYDIFGWGDPALAIPAAADAVRAYLKGP